MKQIQIILISLCIICFIPHPINAEKQFDGNVLFDLPTEWIIQKTKEEQSDEALQAIIPCSGLDSTPLSANVVITTQLNKENLNVTEFGNWKLQNDFKGFAVLEDYSEGQSWRTVLSHVRDDNGTPFVILDRFGVSSEYRTHLRLAFPIVQETSGKWMTSTIVQANNLLKSLTINGKNEIRHFLVHENNALWLK